ncbi:hypothetical protein TRFO_38632 [Tritrichomonas foetus]|uniref:Uncharacterized protein n=1 Tax=Tritrichomonas foetus TaxID=1144522 RepID=A0A1J4J7W9_9EUKA|nr:hypothetical protein TRFO_38632 [Tritrichomonas foetus]|eukprot:OHS95290.1 hypothetical protein TRFO_38632 [Tritrichomonas foetus]
MEKYSSQYVLNVKQYSEILKNKYIWHPENQDNLCVWYCLAKAMFKPPNQRMIISKAKELLAQFYNISLENRNSQNSPINQFVHSYQGFIEEFEKISQFFNINLNIYVFNFSCNELDYELADSYKVQYPKCVINLLCLDNSVICDNPNYQDSSHMLLIKDVEKLTGYWICPKCDSHCIGCPVM